jgi:RNA polymerase sigma factor (sigma-70 family)
VLRGATAGPNASNHSRADPPPAAARGANALTVNEWLGSPYLWRLTLRTAYLYGVPLEDAPDMFQEVCLALWMAGPDKVVNVTWVVHTVQHKAVDFFRKRARLHTQNALSEVSPSCKDQDPDLLHLLRARVALLPKRLQEYYVLRYEAGLSQREIARQLGLCRGSIRWLDRRCLRMVKGRLSARSI